MAVVSLWHIDSGVNPAGKTISDVIDYTENEEKTTLQINAIDTDTGEIILSDEDWLELEGNMTILQSDGLDIGTDEIISKIVEYTANEEKTDHRFVSGINCSPETAAEEFMLYKKLYNKMDKYLVWHGIQSFAPGEVTPDTAHEIGVELARLMWGDDFQVIVTTHLDKAHIHNHLVLNSVSFTNGHKYDYSNKEIYRLRRVSDQLCLENGLSVVEDGKGRGMNYAEWQSLKKRSKPGKRQMIKDDIDEVIGRCTSFRELLYTLSEDYGYEIERRGKYLRIRHPYVTPEDRAKGVTSNRFLRFDGLGKGYTEQDLSGRILEQRGMLVSPGNSMTASQPKSSYIKRMKHYTYFGAFDQMMRGTSVQKIYYLYIFRIRSITKHKTSYPRTHYAARQEIAKLDKYSAQVRFLKDNNLHTTSEVLEFKKTADQGLEDLKTKRLVKRNELKDLQYQGAGDGHLVEIHNEISEITTEMKSLRQKSQICYNVLTKYDEAKQFLADADSDRNKKQERNNDKRKEYSNGHRSRSNLRGNENSS